MDTCTEWCGRNRLGLRQRAVGAEKESPWKACVWREQFRAACHPMSSDGSRLELAFRHVEGLGTHVKCCEIQLLKDHSWFQPDVG